MESSGASGETSVTTTLARLWEVQGTFEERLVVEPGVRLLSIEMDFVPMWVYRERE